MVISETEKTVICLHKENIVGTIGTCKLCGQKRQYDFTNTKDPPKLIKRGRINGLLTDVIPALGSKPIETIIPEPQPIERAKGKYDEHIDAILVDYGQMTVADLERKWSMGRGYFHALKKKWEARGIAIPTAYADRQTAPATVDERAAKLGRPRTGKYLNCVDCGKQIYVRKHRLDANPEAEHRCRKCASKHFIPPPRKKVRVPTVGDKRRKNYKAEGWEPAIRLALRRLAENNTEDPYDKTMNMLAKYLKMEPVETTELLVGLDTPFTVEILMQKAFELFVEELLESMEEVEKVKEGVYKLRK